jgi:hypothetical protein
MGSRHNVDAMLERSVSDIILDFQVLETEVGFHEWFDKVRSDFDSVLCTSESGMPEKAVVNLSKTRFLHVITCSHWGLSTTETLVPHGIV